MRHPQRQDVFALRHRRTRRRPARPVMAFAGLTLVLGVFIASVPVRASGASEAFAQMVIDDGYGILNSTTLSSVERSRQFRDFMLGLTDVRRIALFTLGPYVNSASPADVEAFVETFAEYAVTVYEVRLSQYRGQTLKIVGSVDRAADDSVVNSVVVNPSNPSGPAVQAAFRVREDGGGRPIITDMQVEGVWLAINQRADFTSFLQQNRGSLPALSASLIQQTRQLRAAGNGE